MDGVEDAVDQCPNTLFSDLVDSNGCTKKSLVSPHHFDLIAGVSYSELEYLTLNTADTFLGTLQADYYYKKFSLQASASYFITDGNSSNDTGLYDLLISVAYQLKPLENLSLCIGAGVILPTYTTALNNNNTDYTGSLNLNYTISKLNLFGGYSYTEINDDNVAFTEYQNTHAYSLGAGYYMTDKFYFSGAYNNSNSIYQGTKNIQTASLYGYYTISEHLFSTCSYAYGLSSSASKNYMSVRLGYFF